MAISYINDLEVNDISKEIISLSNDLTNEINNLYKRLSEVPSITKEWVGNQSVTYFSKVMQDKAQYVEFANNLKSIGYKLKSDINEINSCINSNNEKEAEKDYQL